LNRSFHHTRNMQINPADVSAWFGTPGGRYILDWELSQFDNAVDDVFGFNAVQVGLPGLDFLRENRIPLKARVGLEPGGAVRAEPWKLPLASQSIDLIVLPHVLEFCPHPHQILREAERVLMPEGSLVISGFNPLSLWGARRALMRRRADYPWSGRFIGLLRLKDWLALLGFELNGGRFGRYAPPFAQAKWLERAAFMESAGDRWWPIAGGVYVVRGIKRTVGMRLVTPTWRERPVKQAALVQVARRDNVIHVRRNYDRQP
jgi:SAM-dependent methyltransferase